MSSREKMVAYYLVPRKLVRLVFYDLDQSKKTKIELRRCRSTHVGAIIREEDSTVSGRLSNFLQCGFVRQRGSRGKTKPSRARRRSFRLNRQRMLKSKNDDIAAVIPRASHS